MFSLLATTHEPDKIFQKLNDIHRRRLSHWNYHTKSLTLVARFHHCHQALAMINNATNDSLVNWIVLWTLTHPILLVKALRLLIQLLYGRWVTDLCMILTAFSVTQTDVRKSRKHIIGHKSPISKFEFSGGGTVIRTAEAKIKIMIFFYGSKVGPLCLWRPVPAKLSEDDITKVQWVNVSL